MEKNKGKLWFDSHVIVEGLSPAENKKIKKLLEEKFIGNQTRIRLTRTGQ